MDIRDVEAEIVSEFEMFEDWTDKYNYLIELGKSIPEIDSKHKQSQYLIKGCQSQVWLHPSYKDGKVHFTADSDALITKGIVSLLLRVLSGRTPDEIINSDMAFIDKIGLKNHLSPTRANGLTNMIKQVKLYAMAYKAKNQKDSHENN